MSACVLRVSEDIYPTAAVLNTCYVLLDEGYFFIECEGPKAKTLKVHIKTKEGAGGRKTLETLRGRFLDELVYAALRCALARDNRKIREFIVGSALYAQAGVPPGGPFLPSGADYEKDPLGIARTLKKRRGKKTASKV